jgi:hypothetical protein
MKKGQSTAVVVIIAVCSILLLAVPAVPEVGSSVRAARPWTSLLGCLVTLWVLVVSGFCWYKTDPWDMSVVSPGGAFAVVIFALSIIASFLLWLHMRSLLEQPVPTPGRLAAAAGVLLDGAGVIMPVASAVGTFFLLQPFFAYRPPRGGRSRSRGRNL